MFVFLITLPLKLIFSAICLLFLALIAMKIRKVFFSDIMCKCRVNMSGKVVVVTGGNGGIGFEISRILAGRGARVIIAGFEADKLQPAAQAISDATGNPDVVPMFLDLSKFSSIKQFVNNFNKTYDRLDVLIHNAGYFSKEQTFTDDGIETVMQTNHVGPTYLTTLLLDKLKASKPSRIVFVSSVMHKYSYFDPEDIKGERNLYGQIRYANSKLCNVLTTRALSKILPEGMTVNALHPGTAATGVYSALPPLIKGTVMKLLEVFAKTVEECAQTTVHLAMSPALANVSGKYFYECQIAKTHKIVTDELAELTWNNTLELIKEKTKDL